MCQWRISVPKMVWKEVMVSIWFTQIDPGVNVYLYGMVDQPPNFTRPKMTRIQSTVIPEDQQPVVGKEYTLMQPEDLLVLAYPKDGAVDTGVEFEF